MLILFFKKIYPFVTYPLIALLISILLTKLCIRVLPFFGMIDKPNDRNIHERPVPLGGGIAIIFATILAVLAYMFSPYFKLIYDSLDVRFLTDLGIPLLVLFICCLIDDKYALRARYKLLFQIIVAIICWMNGIAFSSLFGIALNDGVSFILTLIWIVAFINAFNLIDGIDGLAAGIGAISSFCMASVFILNGAIAETVLMLCLGCACLGFLRYNFYPARIFMGDTGSMFIGFIIAVTGIISSYKAATFSAVLIPILAGGVPLFDSFLAVWRRFVRKILSKLGIEHGNNKRIMTADKEHLHHRVLGRVKSQRTTTLILYSLSLLLGLFAVSFVLTDSKSHGIVFVILMLLFVLIFRRLAGIELWNSAQILFHGLRKPQKSILGALAHPLIDTLIILLALAVSSFLFFDGSYYFFTQIYLKKIAYILMPMIIVLYITGVYKVYWLRVSSSDLLFLSQMILFGAALGFVISFYSLSTVYNIKLFFAEYLLFYLITTVLILGERMFLRYGKFAFIKNLYFLAHSNETAKRVLVYGGGLNLRFYLSKKYNKINEDPIRIIGIIDDEPVLRRRYVYNCKVLGNSNEITEVYSKYPFDELVITSENISEEKKAYIKAFCNENNIFLTEAYFKITVY